MDESEAETKTAELRFTDGHVESVEVPDGTSVLDAARGAELPLASQCRSGSCGTCEASLVEGDTEGVPGRLTAILDTEYQRGARLLCSTLLSSGTATFDLPYPSDVVFGEQPKIYQTQVSELTRLSDTVLGLDLEVVEGAINLKPGQYVRVRVPETDEWRSYSAAKVSDGKTVPLHVRILPDGLLSAHLARESAVGDFLDIEGPFGSFVWQGTKTPHLFIAGGTGLAPIMSMIDAVRENGQRSTQVTLCYAAQTERDLYHEEEVELRTLWMPRMKAKVAVTNPSSPEVWSGIVGTPVSLIEQEDITENTTAYVCGPPGMITAAVSRLIELGLPSEQIYMERFSPSDT